MSLIKASAEVWVEVYSHFTYVSLDAIILFVDQ